MIPVEVQENVNNNNLRNTIIIYDKNNKYQSYFVNQNGEIILIGEKCDSSILCQIDGIPTTLDTNNEIINDLKIIALDNEGNVIFHTIYLEDIKAKNGESLENTINTLINDLNNIKNSLVLRPLSSSKNLNDYKQTGLYKFTNDITISNNFPITTQTEANLTVLNFGNFIIQELLFNTGEKYKRYFINNEWGDWNNINNPNLNIPENNIDTLSNYLSQFEINDANYIAYGVIKGSSNYDFNITVVNFKDNFNSFDVNGVYLGVLEDKEHKNKFTILPVGLDYYHRMTEFYVGGNIIRYDNLNTNLINTVDKLKQDFKVINNISSTDVEVNEGDLVYIKDTNTNIADFVEILYVGNDYVTINKVDRNRVIISKGENDTVVYYPINGFIKKFYNEVEFEIKFVIRNAKDKGFYLNWTNNYANDELIVPDSNEYELTIYSGVHGAVQTCDNLKFVLSDGMELDIELTSIKIKKPFMSIFRGDSLPVNTNLLEYISTSAIYNLSLFIPTGDSNTSKTFVFMETWIEKISDRDFYFQHGNVQSINVKLLNNIPSLIKYSDNLYTGYGNWDKEHDYGYGLKWSSLTEDEKKNIIKQDSSLKIHNGEIYQIRYRIRSEDTKNNRGYYAKNNTIVSNISSTVYDGSILFVPKGKLSKINNINIYANGGFIRFNNKPTFNVVGSLVNNYIYTDYTRHSNYKEIPFYGVTPIAFIQKRNRGIYHPKFNYGGNAFAYHENTYKKWNELPETFISSVEDCFDPKKIAMINKDLTDVVSYESYLNGDVNQELYLYSGVEELGLSPREDGLFIDRISVEDIKNEMVSATPLNDYDSALIKYRRYAMLGTFNGSENVTRMEKLIAENIESYSTKAFVLENIKNITRDRYWRNNEHNRYMETYPYVHNFIMDKNYPIYITSLIGNHNVPFYKQPYDQDINSIIDAFNSENNTFYMGLEYLNDYTYYNKVLRTYTISNNHDRLKYISLEDTVNMYTVNSYSDSKEIINISGDVFVLTLPRKHIEVKSVMALNKDGVYIDYKPGSSTESLSYYSANDYLNKIEINIKDSYVALGYDSQDDMLNNVVFRISVTHTANPFKNSKNLYDKHYELRYRNVYIDILNFITGFKEIINDTDFVNKDNPANNIMQFANFYSTSYRYNLNYVVTLERMPSGAVSYSRDSISYTNKKIKTIYTNTYHNYNDIHYDAEKIRYGKNIYKTTLVTTYLANSNLNKLYMGFINKVIDYKTSDKAYDDGIMNTYQDVRPDTEGNLQLNTHYIVELPYYIKE